MTNSLRPSKPPRLSWALRALWTVWAIYLALGLWITLGPVVEHLRSTSPDLSLWLRALLGILLAALALMFTPPFVGSLVTAVMLILLGRRVAWSRWILLVGVLASAVVLTINMVAALAGRGNPKYRWLLAVEVLLFLATAVATTEVFSVQTKAWFQLPRGEARRSKNAHHRSPNKHMQRAESP